MIVLKPASQTPLSALFLAELIDQTALPKGAFNVVTGGGKTIGDALVESDKVKMITFTGSPAVGKGIRDKAGLKKVALELGSNAGLIIDKNVDLSQIVPKCVMGAFPSQSSVQGLDCPAFPAGVAASAPINIMLVLPYTRPKTKDGFF